MDYDPGELKDRIKSTVSMDDVCEMCNIHLPASRKITSIYNPEENTPSLHVYKHDYFDFSTGRGGDQITFVMDHFGTSYGKALKFLARITDDLVSPDLEQKPKELPELAERFYNEPEGLDQDYESARLLIKKHWPTVDLPYLQAMFGVRVVRHALWVPHFSPELEPVAIRGIKTRSLYTGKKHSVTGSTYTTALYRAVNKPKEYQSVIVEGESDCWTMTKACDPTPFVSVYGLPGGAGLWRDSWIDMLGPGPIVILLDDDNAGRVAADQIYRKLKNLDRRVFNVKAPGGRVNEALTNGWKPLGDRERLWGWQNQQSN